VDAAVAAQRALAGHNWPSEAPLKVRMGLHAILRCGELCDAADGGQTFLSSVTAGLLEDEDLAPFSLRELGEIRTRRSGELVRAYELVPA
jgi:hypothetical protein